MNKEELLKKAEDEIGWIRYYGFRDDREVLDLSKPELLYDQIRSIGYAKVNTDLDIRCNGYIAIKYEEGKPIEEMEVLNSRRDPLENLLTPLEVLAKACPDTHTWIYEEINKINNGI